MITPAFSLTATERVLPKLALDFTTASLDSRVTFTRTTNATNPATYTNSSGLVTSATNDQPRFDYDPVALTCKGLLIEESRANLFARSAEFDNASWTKSGSTVTANTVTSPDGTLSGDKMIESATTAIHQVAQSVTVTNNAPYTISVYAKAAERNWLIIYEDSGGNNYAFFNLSTGALGTVNAGTATIAPAGNGWYRCTFTHTQTIGTAERARIGLSTGNATFSYAGDGTSGIYIWGAQLEAGAFATSYIPTTSAALTRNADVATMTGTNFSSWWTATIGASTIWLTPRSTSTLAYLSFDDNTANNKIVLANSTTSGQSKITSGGTLQATLTAGTITANATNKVGCSWNTNDCAGTANATAPATTGSATIPTVTQARIGSDGTAYANAWIQKIMYWPQRIKNNEVQAFTK